MKKYILAAVAALTLGMAAHAADSTGAKNRFYVDPSDIIIDQTTHLGMVRVYLDNETDDFNSFLIDFYLPEGFTIQSRTLQNKVLYLVSVNNSLYGDAKTVDHTVTVTPNSGNMYRFVGYSGSGFPITTGDDLLFSFNVVAPVDFKGTADIEMANIQIAAGNTVDTVKKHLMEDQKFVVASSEDELTDVEELATEEAQPDEERAYDLQGRRIKAENAGRGIYIINGQKVIK